MMRLCPKDGIKTEEERCPECGTATLVLAQNPDSKLSEGTEINGRYRVDKMIGQGGFGAVYKSTHLATDQEMAIKVLGISLDSDESDLIQRFFAEAQITAGLKHPNTIRVFDFGQTEGGALYIAMELLNGDDLNDILKHRKEKGERMSEEETVNIASQVLRSLAEAHMAGLVHRDLKPHNIFLNEVPGDDAVVKVLDFGIAKRLGSNLTGTGQAFGTPNYMSPEQAQNRPVDARSDIYSLGVVMYQCVAMRCPFEGDNPLAVLLSHVTDPPPDLRGLELGGLSEDFIQIVEKALAKDPFDRFDGAIDMRKALRELGMGVSRDTVSVNSSASGRMGSGTPTPSAPSSADKGSFSDTDNGKKLEFDENFNNDATQAYQVRGISAKISTSGDVNFNAKSAFAPSDIAPSEFGIDAHNPARSAPVTDGIAPPSANGPPANPPVTLDGQGSGLTEAFMGLGEVIQSRAETAKPAVEDPVQVAVRGKSAKGVMVLIALVVAAAVGIGVTLSSKGGDPETHDPAQGAAVALASADENAAAQATAAAQADNDKAADADDAQGAVVADADAGQEADAGPVVIATKTFEVELNSKPQGAVVLLNGTAIGKTPLKLKVEENKPLTGNLLRDGYHKRDFFVLHTDAPAKTYTLNKKVVQVIKRPKRTWPTPSRPKTTKPSKPKGTTSALEERL
jgi:eukaryotic-like serine/threonine-protein kinase